MLAIRSAGGERVSLAEPAFGKTDFAGRIVTLVAQHANAEKSKTVKQTTYRGICMIRDNNAHYGSLPEFWATRGARYARQAYCANPEAVVDIYERVARGESLASVGRAYDLYTTVRQARHPVRRQPHGCYRMPVHCQGQTETWHHQVTPVIESAVWWRANKVLDANMTENA